MWYVVYRMAHVRAANPRVDPGSDVEGVKLERSAHKTRLCAGACVLRPHYDAHHEPLFAAVSSTEDHGIYQAMHTSANGSGARDGRPEPRGYDHTSRFKLKLCDLEHSAAIALRSSFIAQRKTNRDRDRNSRNSRNNRNGGNNDTAAAQPLRLMRYAPAVPQTAPGACSDPDTYRCNRT